MYAIANTILAVIIKEKWSSQVLFKSHLFSFEPNHLGGDCEILNKVLPLFEKKIWPKKNRRRRRNWWTKSELMPAVGWLSTSRWRCSASSNGKWLEADNLFFGPPCRHCCFSSHRPTPHSPLWLWRPRPLTRARRRRESRLSGASRCRPEKQKT